MGEHSTWTDLLYNLPGWRHLHDALAHKLGREEATAIIQTHFGLTHILWTMVVLLIVLAGSTQYWRWTRSSILPVPRFGLRAFLEMIADTAYSVMVEIMGEKKARKHLPFIGSLGIFILFSNLMALVPGFGVATTTLKTNVALAVLVFLATHYFGVREHGIGYFKHFLGPVPALIPLMLPIEIISHLARPVSLSLRLLGNMVADHKVVFIFFGIFPLLLPLPFLFLGLLVCFIQAFVFCVLSMIYIAMATEHDH